MVFKKIWAYLTFNKSENNAKGNINLKMMHGINRISIFVFLIALVIMFFKLVLGLPTLGFFAQ